MMSDAFSDWQCSECVYSSRIFIYMRAMYCISLVKNSSSLMRTALCLFTCKPHGHHATYLHFDPMSKACIIPPFPSGGFLSNMEYNIFFLRGSEIYKISCFLAPEPNPCLLLPLIPFCPSFIPQTMSRACYLGPMEDIFPPVSPRVVVLMKMFPIGS